MVNNLRSLGSAWLEEENQRFYIPAICVFCGGCEWVEFDSRRNDVNSDHDAMAAGAGKDEEMPNRVGVLQVFSGIEKRPDSVRESADDQEVKSSSAERAEKRNNHQHCHPAHGEISKQRKTLEAMDEENLEQNPGKREKPNSDQEEMSFLAVESDQKKGRVRAGDEKINGAVIAAFEQGTGRGMDEAMIKSRRQEDQDEAESIDKNSGKLQGGENGISLDQHQD